MTSCICSRVRSPVDYHFLDRNPPDGPSRSRTIARETTLWLRSQSWVDDGLDELRIQVDRPALDRRSSMSLRRTTRRSSLHCTPGGIPGSVSSNCPPGQLRLGLRSRFRTRDHVLQPVVVVPRVGEPGGLAGHQASRLVPAAAVEPDEVRRQMMDVVLDLLAEGVGRPRQTGTDFRMVRLCRSTYDVLMCAGSGSRAFDRVAVQCEPVRRELHGGPTPAWPSPA